MSKTKALIVGVSNYIIKGADNLLFCQNDIDRMYYAFTHGLNVLSEDIKVCGKNGGVLLSDFKRVLHYFSDHTDEDDIFLLYFSGHGANLITTI